MFEVIDSLPRGRGDAMATPAPANVAQVEVCWPLGLPPDPQAPQLCQKRLQAWTLDGNVPPTFAERDARLWRSGLETFQRDAASGRRLSADCTAPHLAQAAQIARWPALGSDTDVQWLVDGRWIARTRGTRGFEHGFEQTGEHTLTALADSGAWASVRFRVLR